MNTSEELLSWLSGLVLGLLVVAVAGSGIFLNLFQDKIFPDIRVNGIEVGGLTPEEALILLENKSEEIRVYSVTLSVDDITISSSSAELGLYQDHEAALADAYLIGRVGGPFGRVWQLIKNSFNRARLESPLAYQQEPLNKMIHQLKQQVDLVGENPSAELLHSYSPGSLRIYPGIPGREVITGQTLNTIVAHAGQETSIAAPVASTSSILSDEEIESSTQRARQLVGLRFILRAEDVRLEMNDQDLISLLTLPHGINQNLLADFTEEWAEEINREPQDAELDYDRETLEVGKFLPDKPGLSLDEMTAQKLIVETIDRIFSHKEEVIDENNDVELNLEVAKIEPDKTIAQTNDLGINELIGFGESEYDHSIPNRIHNVSLTAQRINHTILPPGEEFSFNRALGDVSAATGFRTAYVIKSGRTELGDGGGVCQVSTTLFRSVLDAGLDITRRLPHSYRVSYYELNSKPGIDATVYSGNIDLRFINDTPGHILIETLTDSEELYMSISIYGTDDGRSTEIVDHRVWNMTPALPPEYYPDPTLPSGVTKQIDWAVGGAKAEFTHIVRDAEGEVMTEDTYYSSYRPWSAKYLVGQ